MSELLDQYRQEQEEARRRITLQRLDIKAEQAKPYGDETAYPYRVVWARSAYHVAVDGRVVAYLLCEGAFRSTRWTVYPLGATGAHNRPVHGSNMARSPENLSQWLAHTYSAEHFPTAEELEERRLQAERDRQQRRADQERRERERAQARQRERELAQQAMAGLREIEQKDLTNFERDALVFAMERVGRIALGE